MALFGKVCEKLIAISLSSPDACHPQAVDSTRICRLLASNQRWKFMLMGHLGPSVSEECILAVSKLLTSLNAAPTERTSEAHGLLWEGLGAAIQSMTKAARYITFRKTF